MHAQCCITKQQKLDGVDLTFLSRICSIFCLMEFCSVDAAGGVPYVLPMNRMFTRLPSWNVGIHTHANGINSQHSHYHYREKFTQLAVERLGVDYTSMLHTVRFPITDAVDRVDQRDLARPAPEPDLEIPPSHGLRDLISGMFIGIVMGMIASRYNWRIRFNWRIRRQWKLVSGGTESNYASNGVSQNFTRSR